jgi:hypothetical protein
MIILYFLALVVSVVFFLSFLVFVVFQIIAEFTTDAPFVPVPGSVEEIIVENLGLTHDSVLYDLGCGDARMLLRAVEAHPHIRAVGVEISFFPYLLAKFRTRKFSQITIRRENIFTTRMSDATHIFIYLYPHVFQKLMLRIRTECHLGTTLVSCDFTLVDQQPTRTIIPEHTSGKRGQKILVYEV